MESLCVSKFAPEFDVLTQFTANTVSKALEVRSSTIFENMIEKFAVFEEELTSLVVNISNC